MRRVVIRQSNKYPFNHSFMFTLDAFYNKIKFNTNFPYSYKFHKIGTSVFT